MPTEELDRVSKAIGQKRGKFAKNALFAGLLLCIKRQITLDKSTKTKKDEKSYLPRVKCDLF
jgi:hypothetical protein